MKLLLLVVLGLVMTVADDTQLLKDFNDRHLKFTTNVYKELLKDNSGNLLVCSISIDVILAMVQAGAEGNTAKQLTDGLELPESAEIIEQTFSALATKLEGNQFYNFSNVNKIFVKDGFLIKNTYKSKVVNVFKGDIDNVDFKQPEKVVETVNSWVKEKTNNLIDDVISEKDLHNGISILLISTAYFRGFLDSFSDISTIIRNFHVDKEQIVKVDMMQTFGYFNYYESKELNAKFLELRYRFGFTSDINEGLMTFVLPNDAEGLAELETKIDQVLAQQPYSSKSVNVAIPRFKIEATVEFKSILASLGIVDAFEDNAFFTGIGDNFGISKISNIFQKVRLEFNEHGTNANFTPPINGGSSGFTDFDPPEEFQADRPFLFYINLNGVNVFVGRLNSFPEMDNIALRFNNGKQSKSKGGLKEKTEEKPMISIVEEYTCPCNLN